MATRSPHKTKQSTDSFRKSSHGVGGSAAAGTHTSNLVKRAIKRITGKTMKPIANSPAPSKLSPSQMKMNDRERTTRILDNKRSKAEFNHEVKRDLRAMQLGKARNKNK